MTKHITLKSLVEAIKKFTKPSQETWLTHQGDLKRWGCKDWFCGMEGKVAKFKTPPKHGKDCSLSLLKKYGPTKKLAEVLAERAYFLDYDGGGYNSCSICRGCTDWRKTTPHHERNCPGAIALKLVEVSEGKKGKLKFKVK